MEPSRIYLLLKVKYFYTIQISVFMEILQLCTTFPSVSSITNHYNYYTSLLINPVKELTQVMNDGLFLLLGGIHG